mgnify:CR=1 FL=1
MEQLDQLVQQAAAEFAAAADGAQLEQAKARYLGKAGALTERLKALGKLEPEARRGVGQWPVRGEQVDVAKGG